MSVVVLVTKPEEAEILVSWSVRFALARDTSLTVLCWTYSPTIPPPLVADDEESSDGQLLADEVQGVVDALEMRPEAIEIRRVVHPDPVVAALEYVRREDVQLLVAGVDDSSGKTGATFATNPLLRQSPCNTLVLYVDRNRSQDFAQVLVATTDGPHDRVAVSLAARMADTHEAHATIAAIEEDAGHEAIEVGHRELKQIMREAVVEQSQRLTTRVFLADEKLHDLALAANEHDLMLIGVNNPATVQTLLAATTKPTIGVVKRAPPLRLWRRGGAPRWIPRLNPADYADLIQGLRRGSRSSIDFMVMLGLAAAVASLGLLQNSPAVVIGSMLLAPLMTPMIGSGLALAQANARLARTCSFAIVSGFLLTLAISFAVGVLTPGEELTPQVIVRGDPDILDLLIALFSSVAASFALARPGLLGAVAGVAIATALVPPLCSVGIALAYGQHLIALGAAVLFATNVVAIILAAAITFRLMGATAIHAAPRSRRWVYRVVAVLAVAAIVLAFPLERGLRRQIEFGRPQPLAYPLPRSVVNALTDRLEQDQGVELMLAGRPGGIDDDFDVVLWLSTREPLPRSYILELSAIVRREMEDENLVVEVRSVMEAWEPDQDGDEEPDN